LAIAFLSSLLYGVVTVWVCQNMNWS